MRLLDAFSHCSPAFVFPPGRENTEYPQASLRMDLTQSTGQMALCVISTFVKKRNIAVSAFHFRPRLPVSKSQILLVSHHTDRANSGNRSGYASRRSAESAVICKNKAPYFRWESNPRYEDFQSPAIPLSYCMGCCWCLCDHILPFTRGRIVEKKLRTQDFTPESAIFFVFPTAHTVFQQNPPGKEPSAWGQRIKPG